jgi:hypothetical protein
MKNVFFPPWVGKFYFEKGYNGKKIMVLGESHYCGDCDSCKNTIEECRFVINLVNDYLNYKNRNGKFYNWMRTFTRFTNIFFGEQCNIEKINNFWNSIIYYNYVQKSTEDKRISPTQQMFKNSEDAFFQILKEYNPDIIIVWGKRLWDSLPDNGYWDDKYVLDEQGGKFYFYKGKEKDIPAYYIYHPSTSYINYECTKYLNEVIRLI